ncbi:uncharacterized protein LOC133187979 [Saccostrea echinata]|uniref:uncharacterized protein LOC133187979 n=1 Tax=Saccostrea echinata TaxID=191078 RepID=UPI002A833249|nr:uncharacterized protein LOC133187979 [Saccostrea echinata]
MSKCNIQLIEKEKTRTAFPYYELNEDNCRKGCDENTVFQNALFDPSVFHEKHTDDDSLPTSSAGEKEPIFQNMESLFMKDRSDFKPRVLENPLSFSKVNKSLDSDTLDNSFAVDTSEKSKIVSDSKPEEIIEVDDTDYYDSEDEYWNNHKVREDKERDGQRYMKSSAKATGTGRYRYILFSFYVRTKYPLEVKKVKKDEWGVEQFNNMPIFQRSIHRFASDNDFEIQDVISDGNCLFSAIADQLMINGSPGHTGISLRQTTIHHLNINPRKKNGDHPSSFLTDETWEEYLARMERPGEWGDHIALQALADVFLLEVIIFNVYQDDIRRTEVTTKSNEKIQKKLKIYLGHLGEFHYLSLRPRKWRLHWPYKALLFRILKSSDDLDIEFKQSFLKKSVRGMPTGKYISKSEIDETAEYVSQEMERININKDKTDNNTDDIFKTYSGQELLLEEIEDSQQCMIEDPLHTDQVSGIPLPHLSFILKHLIPFNMIDVFKDPEGFLQQLEGTYFHFIGSHADGSIFSLKDITETQYMTAYYNQTMKKANVVVVKIDTPVLPPFIPSELRKGPGVYFDDLHTYPGYCRLKLPPNHIPLVDENVITTESGSYLQAYNVPKNSNLTSKLSQNIEIKYIGFPCPFLPIAYFWLTKTRKFDFPSQELLNSMMSISFTLIPKAHPKSENPAIEWKYNFTIAEHMIFKSFTHSQKHGFMIFKILIDNMTFHHESRLKTKHLKAIFLNSCEEIPSSAWDTNFSGCVLFVFCELVSCLKRRLLPHHFIPEINLLECFLPTDIDTFCVIIESIRVFPATILQFVAEKHGFLYATKLVRDSLKNLTKFVETRDIVSVTKNTLIPGSFRVAKVLSKNGFYTTAYYLLNDMHRQTQLIPEIVSKHTLPNLHDFFCSAIDQMRQKSSRVILARMYDKDFGTCMADSYLKITELSLAKVIPWAVDDRINWLDVPKDALEDFSSIAEFLFEYSLREYERRNKILSTLTIETCIRCIRHAIQEDLLDIRNIEDIELKQEILSQKQELKARLKQYYLHVFYISRLDLQFSPLIEHMPAIEKLCKEFPDMALLVSEMFAYLKMDDESRKYASHFSRLFRSGK